MWDTKNRNFKDESGKMMKKMSGFVLGFFLILTPQPSLAGADPLIAGVQQDGRDRARTLIELSPINFNLIEDGRVRGAITIEIVLELLDSANFEEIKAREPQIQSDFLQALTGLAKARFRVDRAINPDLVSYYLQPVVDKRIGAGKVDLFVNHALITPLNQK